MINPSYRQGGSSCHANAHQIKNHTETTTARRPNRRQPKPRQTARASPTGLAKRNWVTAPDPFGIASDNLAGVRLFESKQDRQMAIKFGEGRPEDKPSQAVIDKMKEAGYRWNPADRIWAHPVRAESAMSTRIDAEKLYQEVRQMIRQEKGIESGQEIPF